MAQVFPTIQASVAFDITPSDTLNIKDDPNNTGPASAKFAFCFLKNPSLTDAVEVRVLPADAPDDDAYAVTIGVAACATDPLAVKRVYATSPTRAEGDVIAYIGKQR
jgi:hypothetical protein